MLQTLVQRYIGQKFLITCDNWFFAPDGQSYKAVFGEVKGVHSDKETLGIETNSKSTNWYLEIGNVIIAGCQIHYAVRTDVCDCDVPSNDLERHEDKPVQIPYKNRIYNTEDK